MTLCCQSCRRTTREQRQRHRGRPLLVADRPSSPLPHREGHLCCASCLTDATLPTNHGPFAVLSARLRNSLSIAPLATSGIEEHHLPLSRSTFLPLAQYSPSRHGILLPLVQENSSTQPEATTISTSQTPEFLRRGASLTKW